MAAGAGGLIIHLWNEWGIQMMVLVSFSLQLFLLFFGGIRRRRSSALLRVGLWWAYLLADSTAIYALGRLSTGSSRLVAFWAPFLLLHLGGPDNITAYALEDNRLWLRHLQTLAVQVLGAAYVLYRNIHNGLQLASIFMLVVGLVKYGERIWALKCANILLSSSSSSAEESAHQQVVLREGSIISDDEEILLLAHSQFSVCKCVFADTSFVPSSLSKEDVKALLFHQKTEEGEISDEPSDNYKTELLNKMVELELSLMYDVLYTKARVIHTWYGFCIHLISMLGTATAFLLFLQFSNSHRSEDGGGYRSRRVVVDVIISYVLLVGALALEVTSFCRALLSSWTCYALSKWGGCCWVVHVLTRLRRHVQPARRRLWSGSIGQYNLLHLSTRDRNEIGNKLAMNKMTGLRDWWSKLHFSGSFSPSGSLSLQHLKNLVLLEVCKNVSHNPNNPFTSRGMRSLGGYGWYRELEDWTVKNELDHNILVWHIATNVCIHKSKDDDGQNVVLAEATQVLSNYMMFLLVAKPDMLPGRKHRTVYLDLCKYLDSEWTTLLTDVDNSSSPRGRCNWNPHRMLKELFRHQGPDHSRIPQRKKLAEKLLSKFDDEGSPMAPLRNLDIVAQGVCLAKELIFVEESMGRDKFEVIFGVWVEMMLYAAEHCGRDSHARQISNGGELITIVWLFAHHLRYHEKLMGDSSHTLIEPTIHPMVEVSDPWS